MGRDYSGIQSRKGIAYLPRFQTNLPFESVIEETYARITGMNPAVQAIRRAESVAVFTPDGTQHSYTADFTVVLAEGREITIECKPSSLLDDLLRAEPAMWHARAEVLRQQGRPLHLVTEADLPRACLEHERAFAAFVNTAPHPGVRQRVLSLLRERGAMTLTALRGYVQHLDLAPLALLDGTLNGMLARQEVVADVQVVPPDCLVDLPGGSVAPPPVLTGRLLAQVLRDLPTTPAPLPAPVSTPPQEHRFLGTKRGQRYLSLFALYSDPTVPFGEDTVTQLAEQTGLSRATLYRYRQALLEAGAPNIVFADLVPYLSKASGKVRRRVDERVSLLMERLSKAHYFVPLGTLGRARSISDLHGLVRAACLREELPPPVYNTVAAHIARMEARDPVEARKRRHGLEEAQKLQARQGHLDVQRYGELLGVDCTPCDVFTREGVIAPVKGGRGTGQRREGTVRGHIVNVVDVATSRILQSVIFPGAISAARVLVVLRDVFLGETGGMVPRVPSIPRRIRMDAGTEFVNRQVARVLAELGIEVLPRNKGTRHHGGIEERMIGTLSHSHHVLPGTTTGNVAARGDYDAQRGATWSLDDLRRYHQEVVARLNRLCAPLRDVTRDEHAARLVAEGRSLWRPLSEAQLAHVRTRLMPLEMKRCGRAGVSLHGLTYTSPALEALIARRAEVGVLYDPDDISRARVVHPDTGVLIEVTARLPMNLEPPLALSEWQGIHARIRASRQAAADRVKPLSQLAAEIEAERQEKRLRETREQKQTKAKRQVASLSPSPKKPAHDTPVILLEDNAPLLEA